MDPETTALLVEAISLVPAVRGARIGVASLKAAKLFKPSGNKSKIEVREVTIKTIQEWRDSGRLRYGDEKRGGSDVWRKDLTPGRLLELARTRNSDERIGISNLKDGGITLIQGNQRIRRLLEEADRGRINVNESIPVRGSWPR